MPELDPSTTSEPTAAPGSAADGAPTLVPNGTRTRPGAERNSPWIMPLGGAAAGESAPPASSIIVPPELSEASVRIGGRAEEAATLVPIDNGPRSRSPGAGLSLAMVPEHDNDAPTGARVNAGESGWRQPGLPKRIGHYNIRRLIGEGGMGAVYEAEQESPKRVVALKIMRAAIVSPSTLRRFEYESQLLARLRHPGIAQVFEAGTHEDQNGGGSVPFYAMKFIPDALALTDYTGTSNLSVRDRIELFIKVCDAVHHGHQKGVIHRDLKPVNILVDATGQPKIIDFGVARGGENERDGSTMNTDAGSLVGTLQYMSPEQCGPDSADLDTRSDVYALGVILFELLTGRLPYDVTKTTIYEATRIIREDPPRRPSAVVAGLPRDLETVCLKALEKDRNKRYQSAADFAADLLRYLNDEPILARPIGPGGRLVRWVRRNRTLATTSAVALVVLIAVSSFLIGRIIVESNEKYRQLLLAQEANRYMDNLLGSLKGDSAPVTNQVGAGGTVNVRAFLDSFSAKLDKDGKISPETEAYMRLLVGRIYTNLSGYDKAKKNLLRSIEIRRKLVHGPDAELATTLHEFAAACYWNGELESAEKGYLEALAIRRQLPGDTRAEMSMSITHLAAVRLKQRRLDEAEDLYSQALRMRQEIYGKEHEDVAASLSNLGKCLLEKRDFVRAEEFFRASLDMVTNVRGENDPFIANAAMNLGNCLYEIGKLPEAETEFQRALDIRRSKYEASHHWVALSRLGLAKTELALGRGSEALELIEASREAIGRLSDGHPDRIEFLSLLGESQTAAEHLNDALTSLTTAMSMAQQLPNQDPALVADIQGRLGDCLAALGRFDEAEPLLRESCTVAESLRGGTSTRAQLAYARLMRFYERNGDKGNAELYRSKLIERPTTE